MGSVSAHGGAGRAREKEGEREREGYSDELVCIIYR